MQVNVQSDGQHVVKRYVLYEGSTFTYPLNAKPLKSEVVVDSKSETEVLELWLAVPTTSLYTPPVELDAELPDPPVNRLLHSRTLIDEDDYDFSDEVDDEVDFDEDDEDDEDEYYYD